MQMTYDVEIGQKVEQSEIPIMNAADEYTGMCSNAMVDVSETEATIILVLNIFAPLLGTVIASCLDKRGFNCSTLCLAFLQGLLFPLVIGYIWGIFWACSVKNVAMINAGSQLGFVK